jgi:hypothetical protein
MSTSKFSAILIRDQSIPHAVLTKIRFNAVEFDENGDFNLTTWSFKPTVAGYYFASMCAALKQLPVGKSFEIAITKNSVIGDDAEEYCVSRSSMSWLDNPELSTGKLFYLNGTTDKLEAWAYHNSGVNKNLFGFRGLTSFTIHQVQ